MNTKIFTKSNVSTLINTVEKNIKNGKYDYLVNQTDAEFSEVHIIENEDNIDTQLEGWHLWLIKNSEYILVQTVINEYGFDHHCLTDEEIYNFFEFFTGDNYNMNKK